MLKEYQIKNFKAFAGSVNIPIKPITLIFGANSSGKSSIFQSLLMLKQTLQEGKDSNISLLPRGNIVDLGSYREFIHNHDVTRSFSFKMTFPTPKEICEAYDIDYSYTVGGDIDILQKSISTETIGLSITFSWDRESSNIIISVIDLYIGNDSKPIIAYKIGEKNRRGSYEYEFTGNFDHKYWHTYWKCFGEGKPEAPEKKHNDTLEDANDGFMKEFEKMSGKGKAVLIGKLKKCKRELDQLKGNERAIETYKSFGGDILTLRGFLPEDLNCYTLKDIMDNEGFYIESKDVSLFALTAANLIKKLLKDIEYIAPLREYPERFYIYGGNPLESVGSSGKMVFDVLFNNPELLDKVNNEFKRFGTDYELKLSPYMKDKSKTSEVFVPELFNKSTGVAASFRDVGFGFSQVLPVIVQSMLSKEKTLLIEQPELHLHPALQAELGSLFAQCIKEPCKNCFIIETHSEHLILRIQKLIRKGQLTPDDISVIYIDKGTEKSNCLPLRLDNEGDFIDEWPDGFFEEGYKEIFD